MRAGATDDSSFPIENNKFNCIAAVARGDHLRGESVNLAESASGSRMFADAR